MMQKLVARCSTLAMTLVVASACYSYQPVQSPAPGTVIRIHVPVASPVVRPNQAPPSVSFEGTLVSLGDTMLLEVTSRREVGAFREILELDTLRVAESRISLLEERLFSKPKTYAFTAALTIGSAWLGIKIMNTLTGESGDPDRGDGTDPLGQLILNPIFSGLLRLIGR